MEPENQPQALSTMVREKLKRTDLSRDLGRNDAKAETPVLGPPDAKS